AMAGHTVDICSSMPTPSGDLGVPVEGIRVHTLNEYEGGLFSSVHQGLRGLFIGDITVRWLQSLRSKPDAIVLYGTHLGYLLRLLPFCKRYGIPLFLDVVEWYDPRHLPGGVFGPVALSNELSMRYFAMRANGLFVISRYLQQHFERRGCETLRIPPLFSLEPDDASKVSHLNGMVNLCYVGSPGKKEDMKSIFLGLQLAREKGANFAMHVVGLTADEFARDFGMHRLPIIEKGGHVKFYGRVKNDEARAIVTACDFLVLVRKELRFTQAGFPSKVAESLCLGVPVMGNLSSDLRDYLQDGDNAIIVSGPNAEAFCNAVMRAASLDANELSRMRRSASSSADSNFRVRTCSEKIARFIETVS
ncbi:MAG: glycosyltransferase, partial [Pyrinomonadaceae bacterium]